MQQRRITAVICMFALLALLALSACGVETARSGATGAENPVVVTVYKAPT